MPFRVLWNASPDAMALTDAVGQILAANPAYCALHGYLPNQLDGQSLAVIFPEAERPAAMAHYKAVFASGDRPHIYPAVTELRDSSDRLVESRIDFLRQEDGQLVMMSSVRVLPAELQAESSDLPLGVSWVSDNSPTAAEVLIDAIHTWGLGIVAGVRNPDARDRSATEIHTGDAL